MDAAVSAEDFSAIAASSTTTLIESSGTTLATPTETGLPLRPPTATLATTLTSTRDDGRLETIQLTIYQTAAATASPTGSDSVLTGNPPRDGSRLSSSAAVATAICVTLTAVTVLVLIWYFVRRHHRRKAREAMIVYRQLAEEDGPERMELCGDTKPHEAPNSVTHEMCVPPYEIFGAPIEGPTQLLRLSPDVEYSHTSKDSRVDRDHRGSEFNLERHHEEERSTTMSFLKRLGRGRMRMEPGQ